MDSKVITDVEMINLLCEKRGAKIISFESNTSVRLLKTWNRGEVRKISVINGFIGWDYENSVNNQRDRENILSDFNAEKNSAGTRVAGTPFLRNEKTNNNLLWIKVQRVLDNPCYMLDQKKIDESEFEDFLPAKSTSSRQGVEDQIIPRAYGFRNIVSITYKKNKYVIIHPYALDKKDENDQRAKTIAALIKKHEKIPAQV